MKFLILLFSLVFQVSHAMQLKPSSGRVQFEAVGRPSMMKIKGTGAGPEGPLKIQDGKVSGDLKFALSTLDTKIELRNEHMKEKYLETKKYPEAVLSLKELSLPATWSLTNPVVKESPFSATLDLHGVKKDITGTFSISGNTTLEARFEIKISDFKIDIPSYLGITVADTVKVQVVVDELSK